MQASGALTWCTRAARRRGQGWPRKWRCTSLTWRRARGGWGAPFAHSLAFDACFESGNLYKAVQRGDAECGLFLRPDVHTEGHTQWFYFAIGNTHPPRDEDAGAEGAAAFLLYNIEVGVEVGLQIKIRDQKSMYLWGGCMHATSGLRFSIRDYIHGF